MTVEPAGHPPERSTDAPSWPDGCVALVHQLWGDAITGKPYDRLQKAKFGRLVSGLQLAAARGRLGQK